ncbi:GNAT family N-acetyltransferase [Paenibacillus agricola]|uniref:GNAT family N-acetyltransferase n=1 Tax=Paenibacillus agricola TaxID=2716264 RepID=A0ABX0J6B5_9BACL|nr:GNAT family N-acetyltransferase [Paenibacillus agricola]NHN31682.1 GNAT family N-acetyltransferase [Paenibacillus agricola]
MLIDIKPRLDEAGIQELLGYATFPDPERLKKTVDQYKNNGSKLQGYESEGEIIGLIGYSLMDNATGDFTIKLEHIAVDPEERGKGFGRGIILELLELEKPNVLLAETDEEAVDFYRSLGFAIASLGEKYPGVERFQCTFFVDEE